MKKLTLLMLSLVFMGLFSCRDNKKEQEQLDATLDKIEAVESEVDETIEAVEQKTEEVESALEELDSL
ncbi:hypothetical protein ACJD0Z_12220 [Flavobacteriaceae bacterium M23B6Z8]